MVTVCPRCGNEAQEQLTRFGIRRFCCGLWSWHGRPLTDIKTQEARSKAHEAFDKLWMRPTRCISRPMAYKLLRAELGLNEDECHMSLMSQQMAERVPAAVEKIKRFLL